MSNLGKIRQWKMPGKLKFKKLILAEWPYIHVDVFAEDENGKEYIFGVPIDEKGLDFYVIPNKIINKEYFVNKAPKKVCPFCNNIEMKKVKLFCFREILLQYKCPQCFYVTTYSFGDKDGANNRRQENL